ncbi:bacteriocin fulvocin C-related protein [Nonlabens tegetincola]|uniref:bacteriocin fulvocin C-related protein n=1 Tax=Nonlabens tegetincola TaxID=323273 RepID=UPI000CF450D9|nr:bacteriocin fulvocin C-related protein [Nonlabens tegetincola]PQJ18311.1 hypothetical protein BST93_07385 [Nonlabens tegetincola]
MKKFNLLLLLLLAVVSFSCQTDSEEPLDKESNQILSKSGFDAESTYFSILSNTEDGMIQFDNLDNTEKQAVWVFKYNRFITDNALNTAQLDVVNAVKNYVESVDFDTEPNDAAEASLEDQIQSVFDEDTSSFLLLTLENGPSDINQSGATQTEGCFWCDEIVSGSEGPCEAVWMDTGAGDGHIAYVRPVKRKKRRFWIGWGSEYNSTTPCTMQEFINEG